METYNQEKIFEILSKKSEDKFIQIQRILSKMDSHEIAHCLESTPSEQRKVIWSIIDKSNEADVLSELGEEIQQDLFDEISELRLSSFSIDFLTVLKFVSVPPSHLLLTYGIPQSIACFFTKSLAALFVPTNNILALFFEIFSMKSKALLNCSTLFSRLIM